MWQWRLWSASSACQSQHRLGRNTGAHSQQSVPAKATSTGAAMQDTTAQKLPADDQTPARDEGDPAPRPAPDSQKGCSLSQCHSRLAILLPRENVPRRHLLPAAGRIQRPLYLRQLTLVDYFSVARPRGYSPGRFLSEAPA